ncbi:hypothetical protein [Bifidobacterium aerophilum]|uniref:Uncharacterized protein n=1 Tax=Bifidobacterium aerophilum TaxID=1798155 RepID=A0A6N9Z4S0_9BIFI|nr:hypothetical protein [Bifidobacterium aerophilum]NEG89145.1 hypothetical protein [Bifidobacterium aerophilum]
MNISALAERIQSIRTTDVTDTGAGLIVRDSRTPYLKLYIHPAGVFRSRWEYPQPNRRGRIPGLTDADLATVAEIPRRTIDLGMFRLPDDLDAATEMIRRHLDRQAFQIAPHRLHHPMPRRKVMEAYRDLTDDLMDRKKADRERRIREQRAVQARGGRKIAPESDREPSADELERAARAARDERDRDVRIARNRAAIANALATADGPSLIAAFVIDELDLITGNTAVFHVEQRVDYGSHDRSLIKEAAVRLSSTRVALTTENRERLEMVLDTLLDLVNRVPDRVLAAKHMSRRAYAPALALIAWWLKRSA